MQPSNHWNRQAADPTDSSAALKQTELHACHVALGARMTDFAGFAMPLQYSGIMDEHMAVRKVAGLFDVSHMGEILVRGPRAFPFVQHVITNDAASLADGEALYTLMCNGEGGILDDLLVYRLRSDAYMLVVNAANTSKDFAWMQAHNPMGAELHDTSSMTALIALQGPRSVDILERVTSLAVRELAFYRFLRPKPGSFLGLRRSDHIADGIHRGDRLRALLRNEERARCVADGARRGRSVRAATGRPRGAGYAPAGMRVLPLRPGH